MANRKRETKVYKTLCRKLGVNSGAPEGRTVSAPLTGDIDELEKKYVINGTLHISETFEYRNGHDNVFTVKIKLSND